MRGKSYVAGAAVLALALLGGAGLVMSQQVEDARGAAAKMDEDARRSQANIDKLVGETRSLERQYSEILKEIDGLEVYNTLLQKQIDSQRQEMEDLNTSIDQVSVIERQVMPLMLEMIEGLDQFVELDMPFLLEERQQRVANLRVLMERGDISVAEKVRRVFEAFEIENDYGRTIEAYKGSLELDGTPREVDFLRIGRIALLYQTVDAKTYGMWDKGEGRWTPLPAEYRNQIRNGLKMARKQIPGNLLLLPVAAPEAAE